MRGMPPMTSMIFKFTAVSLLCLMILFVVATPAQAQHGDWILGSNGLDSGSQPPQGIYYQNLWSYYHASGSDFAAIGPLKFGPLDKACLSLNVGGSGNLDLFFDQNILGWTSPYKILGANYGLFVDIPMPIVVKCQGLPLPRLEPRPVAPPPQHRWA